MTRMWSTAIKAKISYLKLCIKLFFVQSTARECMLQCSVVITVTMTVGPPKDIPWQCILSPALVNKLLRTDPEQACGSSGTILQFLCCGARPDLTCVQKYPQIFKQQRRYYNEQGKYTSLLFDSWVLGGRSEQCIPSSTSPCRTKWNGEWGRHRVCHARPVLTRQRTTFDVNKGETN